tara:strand:- start:3 stop:806 length:804 start_codon:yes stop_codon:yes gene_type:complete
MATVITTLKGGFRHFQCDDEELCLRLSFLIKDAGYGFKMSNNWVKKHTEFKILAAEKDPLEDKNVIKGAKALRIRIKEVQGKKASASEIINNLEMRIAKLERKAIDPHRQLLLDELREYEMPSEEVQMQQATESLMRSVDHWVHTIGMGFIEADDPQGHGVSFNLRSLRNSMGTGFITERMVKKNIKNLKVVKEFDVAKGVLNQHYEIMIELVSCRGGRKGYDCVFNLELVQDGRRILDEATIKTAKGRVEDQAARIAEQFLTVIRS